MDAIYARQSVDKADSLSIQGQINLCRQKAGDSHKIYQDKGYSGKNTNRPAFQRMMEDVERGVIRKIIVYRLDRFSRSIADFGRLWEILKKHNVEFVSINETFDTSTPMGRAMLNIIMVFAQLERETTAERVRDNYYQRARLGSWPGGPAPYGFSIGKLPGQDGKLAPGLLPDEHASVVERIFRSYANEGASLGSVARELNGDGIPAPRRDTTIEKLETQRGELLERQTKLHKTPRQTLGHLKFGPLTFEQKKLVAAQFIQKIELGGDTAKVIWKI